jgi:hypothetical protein
MTQEDLVGRCGLYCGACSIYRAHKDNGEYLIRLSKRFKCPPEKIQCEGCQILSPECWGNDCKIVQCLRVKNYEFCYECQKYEEHSCEKYEKLAKGYMEDNVDIRAGLEKTKSGKSKEWLRESKKRFKCPYCKKSLPAGSKRCYHCNKEFPQI